jgi:hypothetical protein
MLSSSDIKREIIKSASTSPMKKRIAEVPDGVTEGDQVEMGNALEAVTKLAGWAIIENYMITRANVVGMAMKENVNDVTRGTAKGYIELMQWVTLSIERKNEILERERLHEESSPKKHVRERTSQAEDVPI